MGVLVALCAALCVAPAASGARLKAKITRSAHGIPNIEAKNFESLGFGYGYAFAEDNICTIADSYVTTSAQRSRFFGPDARQRATPTTTTNAIPTLLPKAMPILT